MSSHASLIRTREPAEAGPIGMPVGSATKRRPGCLLKLIRSGALDKHAQHISPRNR
jgi:hypothetical protein